MNDDAHYLRMAIAYSQESIKQDKFPAGAVVVVDYHRKPVTYTGMSGDITDFRHAEVNAIEAVLAVDDPRLKVKGSTLYSSMEPCLMCLTTAYWAGVKKIVYAIRRSEVDSSYYESTLTSADLQKTLHESIELVHISELEENALDVVREWEM